MGRRSRHTSSRRGVVCGGAFIVVLALTVIAWEWRSVPVPILRPAAATSVHSASLQLDGTFGSAFAGDMVAVRLGLFHQERVELALDPGGSNIDPIQLVIDGAKTVGETSAIRFMLARARGAPIVAFAAGYVESPVVLYALESSGIRTPGDLTGRTIGVKAGDDTTIVYEALMAKLDISRSRVREATVGAPLASLLNGAIDVWPGTILPSAREFLSTGTRYNVIKPSNYGVHVPGTVYFASETTVRDHPDLIQRILRAIISGWEHVYADYDTSIPLLASFIQSPPTADLVRFDLDIQRDFVRPLGRRFTEFDDDQWRSLNEILVQQKLVRAPIDLHKAVTFEFLHEAYRKSSGFGKQDSLEGSMFTPLDKRMP